MEKIKNKPLFLKENITETVTDILKSLLTYIILDIGFFLIFFIIGSFTIPVFNQKEAIVYSFIVFMILIIRQMIGQRLSFCMNTITAEIISLLISAGLSAVVFHDKLNIRHMSDTIGLIIIIIIRYILVQGYFDSLLKRKNGSFYPVIMDMRRKNLLPAFMSLLVMMNFIFFRNPDFSEIIISSSATELIFSIATIIIINIKTKPCGISKENIENAKNLLIVINLCELSEKAYLHKKKIFKMREELKIGNDFLLSKNTLVTNIDTFIFNRKIIPNFKTKNVLFYMDKNVDEYGNDSEKKILSIAEKFVSEGYVVYFNSDVRIRSSLQESFEKTAEKSYIVLRKQPVFAFETVLHSMGEYNKKCSEYIREKFGILLSDNVSENVAIKTLDLQIRELISEHSLLDMFYELIQTAELFFHIVSLCAITDNMANEKNIRSLPLGTMIEIAEKIVGNKKISDDSLKESVRFIETLCSSATGGSINSYRVFHSVSNLRNRYLGHGTMTYSVSEELVYHLTNIVVYITETCYDIMNTRYSEKDLMSEKLPFCDDYAAVSVEDEIYFYSNTIYYDYEIEYINPLNGQLYQNCEHVRISTCLNRGDELIYDLKKGDDIL